jgi:hypothetical protein
VGVGRRIEAGLERPCLLPAVEAAEAVETAEAVEAAAVLRPTRDVDQNRAPAVRQRNTFGELRRDAAAAAKRRGNLAETVEGRVARLFLVKNAKRTILNQFFPRGTKTASKTV